MPGGSTMPSAHSCGGEPARARRRRRAPGRARRARASGAGRPVDRDDEQPVVAAGAQARDRAHRVAAEAVGDEPLARGRLVEVAAGLGAEPDHHGSASCDPARSARRASGSAAALPHDQVGDQARPAGLVRGAEPGAVVAVEVLVEERCCRSSAGSCCSASTPPKHGPPAVRRRRGRARSAGARGPRRSRRACSCVAGAGRVLDRDVVAEEAARSARARSTTQVVDAGTRSARASWSCRRTCPWSTRPARSRSSTSQPVDLELERVVAVAARDARAGRRATGTPPRRTAARAAAAGARRRRRRAAAARAGLADEQALPPRGVELRAPAVEQSGEALADASGALDSAPRRCTRDGEQRQDADHRAHPHRHARCRRASQPVVEEAVLLVPQPLVVAAPRR